MHRQERRRRADQGVAAGHPGHLAEVGHGAGARRQRPPEEQRAGVDQRPAADGVLGPQLGLVATADGVEVADRELVERRVPGEVAQAVGVRPVAAHPVVHPGQPGAVVAGLVVGVGSRVGAVPGVGRLGERACRRGPWLRRSALLLADEAEQSGVPPVVAVRRRRALHDRPGLLGHLGDAGEGDRRHRHRQQQGIGGVGLEVADDRRSSRRAGGRAIACTWLRSRAVAVAACRSASRIRAAMSTSMHMSWPIRASAAWPRAKVGSSTIEVAKPDSAPARRRSTCVEPAVVRRSRFRGRGEAQPVPVPTVHESRVNDAS